MYCPHLAWTSLSQRRYSPLHMYRLDVDDIDVLRLPQAPWWARHNNSHFTHDQNEARDHLPLNKWQSRHLYGWHGWLQRTQAQVTLETSFPGHTLLPQTLPVDKNHHDDFTENTISPFPHHLAPQIKRGKSLPKPCSYTALSSRTRRGAIKHVR